MSLKTKAVNTKNFVKKHRVAIAVTATSAFWVVMMVKANESHNEFLVEKGLFEEYYTPEPDPAE